MARRSSGTSIHLRSEALAIDRLLRFRALNAGPEAELKRAVMDDVVGNQPRVDRTAGLALSDTAGVCSAADDCRLNSMTAPATSQARSCGPMRSWAAS